MFDCHYALIMMMAGNGRATQELLLALHQDEKNKCAVQGMWQSRSDLDVHASQPTRLLLPDISPMSGERQAEGEGGKAKTEGGERKREEKKKRQQSLSRHSTHTCHDGLNYSV